MYLSLNVRGARYFLTLVSLGVLLVAENELRPNVLFRLRNEQVYRLEELRRSTFGGRQETRKGCLLFGAVNTNVVTIFSPEYNVSGMLHCCEVLARTEYIRYIILLGTQRTQ